MLDALQLWACGVKLKIPDYRNITDCAAFWWRGQTMIALQGRSVSFFRCIRSEVYTSFVSCSEQFEYKRALWDLIRWCSSVTFQESPFFESFFVVLCAYYTLLTVLIIGGVTVILNVAFLHINGLWWRPGTNKGMFPFPLRLVPKIVSWRLPGGQAWNLSPLLVRGTSSCLIRLFTLHPVLSFQGAVYLMYRRFKVCYLYIQCLSGSALLWFCTCLRLFLVASHLWSWNGGVASVCCLWDFDEYGRFGCPASSWIWRFLRVYGLCL